MAGKFVLLAVVVAVAIVAAGAGAFFVLNQGGGSESEEIVVPVDPEPIDPTPVDPEPEPEPETIYPKGISYDSETRTLFSEESVVWNVTDQLVAYVDKKTDTYEGKELALDDGFYKIKVGDEEFDMVVGDTITVEASWQYTMLSGKKIDVEISYDIDIKELAEITLTNGQWNKKNNSSFMNLPKVVYVDDTIKSIVDQLKKVYFDNGGSMDDEQSYLDILVSFPQLGITYPELDKKPRSDDNYPEDHHYWGVDEYWANPLQTIYFKVGDCEDASALACSLFKAAGFKTAMIGSVRHVMAAVELDSFEERNLTMYKSLPLGLANSLDAKRSTGGDAVYYGVEVKRGSSLDQIPVGYILNNHVGYLERGEKCKQGVAGYYAVA